MEKRSNGFIRPRVFPAALLVVLLPAVASAAPPQLAGDTQFAIGICKVLQLTEGGLGALIASVAGLLGVISAALGMYRTALNALFVCLGAALIKPMMMLFFLSVQCPGDPAPKAPSGASGGTQRPPVSGPAKPIPKPSGGTNL